MFCKYCGKQLVEGSKFCTACGAKLAAPTPAPVPEPTPAPIPEPIPEPAPAPAENTYDDTVRLNEYAAAETVPQPAPAPVPEPQPAPAPVPEPQPAPAAVPPVAKKKNGGKIALIIILCVVLLGGLAVGGYFLYTEVLSPLLADNSENETEEQSAEEGDETGKESNNGQSGENAEVPDGTGNTGDVTENPGNTGNEPQETRPVVTEPLVTEPPVTEPPTEPPATVPNPYDAYIQSPEPYLLPMSDRAYLDYNDVINLSLDALILAEQEIHARYGRNAADPYMQAYFESRDWYVSSGRNYQLNDYENANLQLLAIHQKMRKNQHYNSGNPYIALHLEAGEYVIPGSNSRYLHKSDAMNLSAAALYVARNEIYARRGMVFADAQLQEYFYTKSWYSPSTKMVYDTSLNVYETNNLVFIDAYARKANRTPVASGTEYFDEYTRYGNRDYMFPNSSYSYLSEYELYGMDADELELARNEIYARHGYTFSDQALRDYFCTKSWYYPDTAVGDQSALNFSKLELANIELMRNYESRVEYGEYQ